MTIVADDVYEMLQWHMDGAPEPDPHPDPTPDPNPNPSSDPDSDSDPDSEPDPDPDPNSDTNQARPSPCAGMRGSRAPLRAWSR